jgi:cell division protein FtsN
LTSRQRNLTGRLKMKKRNKGSVELIVMGLIAALIVVLAIPLLTSIGKNSEKVLNNVDAQLSKAATALPTP